MKCKKILFVLWILWISIVMGGCIDNSAKAGAVVDGYTVAGDLTLEQIQLPEVGEEIAVITTNKGTIKMRLFDEVAPKTVSYIKELISQGFYDGLLFSNFIEDLGFQVVVPLDSMEPVEIMGIEYIEEYHNEYRNFNGAVGLARYNGIGSFYIISNSGLEEKYLEAMKEIGELYTNEIIDVYRAFGGAPDFDMKFNIFGQVFYGLDTVMEINSLPFKEDSSKPVEDIIIEKIELVNFQGK